MKEFKGYHQTDAYSGYAGLHDKKEITWVACWAHARRKYIEITKTIKTPGIAHKMVKYIGQLYKIEREALDKKLDPGETKKLREKNAVPFLSRLLRSHPVPRVIVTDKLRSYIKPIK
ncbi:IS66 family transposase [Candidatus Aquarickettsia rohweri]|uniref:IS66 family transposase n=1 Tax=Candidatus Aquarickettsia rohweri TaxID=2602574 RepID=UPI0023E8C418|nr:transposase [Candidatus Aquarickettsia rohweri]